MTEMNGVSPSTGFALPRLPSLTHRNEISSGTFFTPNVQPQSPSGHPLSPGMSIARPQKKQRTGSELPVSVAGDVGTVVDFSSNEDEGETPDTHRTGGDDSMTHDDDDDMLDEDDRASIATTSTSATPSHQPPHSTKVKKPTKTSTKQAKATKNKGKARADGTDEAGAAAARLLLAAEGAPKQSLKKTQRKNSGERKKKAGRACAACQKAHLTCDDARPCARCVKKGCAAECHDGTRKKAKYLLEIPDELLERKITNPFYQPQGQQHDQLMSGAEETTPLSAAADESPEMLLGDTPHAQPDQQPTLSFEPMPFFDTSSFSNEFGSEAANLEYAILSSMLNGNGFAVDGGAYNAAAAAGALRGGDSGPHSMLINSPLDGSASAIASTSTATAVDSSNPNSFFNFRAGSTQTSPNFGGNVMSPPRLQDTARDLFPPAPGSDLRAATSDGVGSIVGNGVGGSSGYGNQDLFVDEGPPRVDSSASTSNAPQPAPQSTTSNSQRPNVTTMTGEQAYRAVTKPYPYAQSYHHLVKHLKDRFEKNDILRIIRALATFRPSLIALQMPLSEEDETFVERTFQRTLIELNKLISFSGTPTVVWRRTGEICLVGTEFCLLTGWQREELVGNKFIFELMDCSSVVEYYESFAKHAFESTSSSVEMQCVVLGPNGRPVPCAMCFTIRRDLFSCPFLIVGSFLPILV